MGRPLISAHMGDFKRFFNYCVLIVNCVVFKTTTTTSSTLKTKTSSCNQNAVVMVILCTLLGNIKW